jgi:hypothetical protein
MASVKRSTTWLTLVCLAIAPAAVRADGPDAGAADSSAALAAEIETEVPFDRAGRITRLDAPLARSACSKHIPDFRRRACSRARIRRSCSRPRASIAAT